MTEVPPPTRRARKEAPAPVDVPSGADVPAAGGARTGAGALPAQGASRTGTNPHRVSSALPPIPGSAAAAASSPSHSAGAATPGSDAPGSSADSDAPFTDDPERMPTAQLEMAAFGDHLIPYVPPKPPAPRSLAPWALTLAILALVASLFTGWLFPLGAVGVILSAMSLRRPRDSRRAAGWAVALAVLSLVFSAGWLIWGFSQLAVV